MGGTSSKMPSPTITRSCACRAITSNCLHRVTWHQTPANWVALSAPIFHSLHSHTHDTPEIRPLLGVRSGEILGGVSQRRSYSQNSTHLRSSYSPESPLLSQTRSDRSCVLGTRAWLPEPRFYITSYWMSSEITCPPPTRSASDLCSGSPGGGWRLSLGRRAAGL